MNTSPLRAKEFERILLIKPSAVGDVIHTVPVLVKLRARYPAAQIDWLLTPPIAELIRHHPAVSNVVHFPRQDYTSLAAPGSLWPVCRALLSGLWRQRYDLVIDLHGQFRSALFTLASGAPTRIGFDRPHQRVREATHRQLPKEAYLHGWTGAREGAWLAYSHRIPIPTLDAHAVDRYLWLGSMLGLDDQPPDFRIPVPPEARSSVDRLLRSQGLLGKTFAVLVPGTIWETKHWHVEGFAQVADFLSRHNCGRGSGRLGKRTAALSTGAGCLSASLRFVRPNYAQPVGRSDPAGRPVRHQRFRLDAPDRGVGQAGRERVRADRSALDWAIRPTTRSRPRRGALLAVLPAEAPQLPAWPRLHAPSHARPSDRTGRKDFGGHFCFSAAFSALHLIPRPL